MSRTTVPFRPDGRVRGRRRGGGGGGRRRPPWLVFLPFSLRPRHGTRCECHARASRGPRWSCPSFAPLSSPFVSLGLHLTRHEHVCLTWIDHTPPNLHLSFLLNVDGGSTPPNHTHTPSHSHTVALTTSHTHLSHTDSQPHSHSPRHTTCVTTSHTRTVSHPISHTHAQLRSVVLPCTVRRGKGSTEVQHGSMSCRHFHLGRNGDGDRWSGRIHTYVDSRSYPIRTMVRPHPHAPPRDRDTLLTER